MVGGASKDKVPQSAIETAEKLKVFARVKAINGRMPINHQYASKIYPLDKSSISLHKDYVISGESYTQKFQANVVNGKT